MNPRKHSPRTVAELTNHPGLFSPVYWGAFRPGDTTGAPEIIAARNQLVETYGIARFMGLSIGYPPPQSGTDFDHPETYGLKDGRVLLLVSNYNAPPPPTLGMVRSPAIYNAGAESYARVFDSTKALKAAIQAAKGKA